MTKDEAIKALEALADLSGEDRIDWLIEVAEEAWETGHDSRDEEFADLNSEIQSPCFDAQGSVENELHWLRTRIERGEKTDALMLVDQIERAVCDA